MDSVFSPSPTLDYSLFSGGSLSSTTESTDMMDHDNHSDHHHGLYSNYTLGDDIISHPAVQAVFYLIYGIIFILGIFGNVLVCYVVGRNKAMQTVTNFFITNLALADILLCALAVPFTPLYTFLGEWIFGRVLCHLVAYAQGTSVYISTLTLTSIAIDRFFVIIYPFKPRMRLTTCLIIISGIWVFALLATLPYGIFLHYFVIDNKYTCGESWPSEVIRQVFSACTMVLQFFLPFLVILFCYIKVSFKLSDRVKAKPGSKSSKKEAMERERKRRTNRMLIAMVFIFGMSWLPLNVFNLAADLSEDAAEWKYSNLTFFCAHAVAMSSTCYNPFLYAWMNENFRKEFKQVLPCFKPSVDGNSSRSRRFASQRTNCNGAETVQETLLPTTSNAVANSLAHVNAQPTSTTVVQVLETIDELNSSSQAAPPGQVSIDLAKATASFTAHNEETNDVIVHYPSPSFSSTTPSGGPGVSTVAMEHNENNNNNNSNHTNNNNNETVVVEEIATSTDSTKTNEVVIEMDKDEAAKNDGNATVITIEASSNVTEPSNTNQSLATDTDTTSHPSEEESSTSCCGGEGAVDNEPGRAEPSDNIISNIKSFTVNPSVLI